MASPHMKFIAEAGVNHNGSLDLAKQLIDIAAYSGADFVKFQAFRAKDLVKQDAPLARYQAENFPQAKSQYHMLKGLELSYENFIELYEYSKTKNIGFLVTPFDLKSLIFLDELGLDLIKFSSGDLTNTALLVTALKLNKSIILSTGMASLDEIHKSLQILKAFVKNPESYPANFTEQVLSSRFDKDYSCLKPKITLLHCTSNYPALASSLNLNAIARMKSEFGLEIGYSDHSAGIHIPIAAYSLGARVIEKHFTLDKDLPGPDHKASLAPDELKQLITNLKDLEQAMGDGIKQPCESELSIAKIVRKSAYLNKSKKKGEIIKLEDLEFLRPESGISLLELWDYINSPALRDYQEGDSL
jgi:N-acetylneuraminate synthase